MTTKAQLEEQVKNLEKQLENEKAERRFHFNGWQQATTRLANADSLAACRLREANERDTKSIDADLIPFHLLTNATIVTDEGGETAEITVKDARIVKKLKAHVNSKRAAIGPFAAGGYLFTDPFTGRQVYTTIVGGPQ